MVYTRVGGVIRHPGATDPPALSTSVFLVDQNGDPLSLGGSGGTSSTDDAAFTPGASSVTPVGGIVTSDSVDSGDVGAFAMLANRQQRVTLFDSSAVEITSFGGGAEYTEDAVAAADPKGGMLIARRRDSLATETTTDGDNTALNSTGKGELYVKQVDPQPVTGTFWQATQPGSVADAANVTFGAKADAKSTATDTTAITAMSVWKQISASVQAIATSVAGTLTVASHAVTNAGVFAVQVSSTVSTAVTNAGIFAVQPGPTTAGGLANHSALSTAAVYTAQVKGSAGQFYEIEIFNKGAAAVYARLYDQAGAPASTDGANIVWRGIVPGATTGAGFVRLAANGRACATGIGIRISGAIADNDTTILNANEVEINVGYK